MWSVYFMRLQIPVAILALMFLIMGSPSCKKESQDEKSNTNHAVAEESVKPYDIEAEKAGEALRDKSFRTKALIKFALQYLGKNGREKTLDAINNPGNRDHKKFIDGEFYIWVFWTDYNNKTIVAAHAINSTVKGKEWYDVKDADGKQFFHDIVRIAKNRGEGWVLYRWTHPSLKKVMPKVTYFMKSGDLVFNNGFYLE